MRDLLPTFIALFGSLAVALLGYRQWRKQFVGEQEKGLREQRSTAYQQAWLKLEEAHLYVRSQPYQRESFNELARAVNVHLMQAGLLLDEGEKVESTTTSTLSEGWDRQLRRPMLGARFERIFT
jgi:hypothetical protein